jgi:Flp pilus assembly pilin Flp
MHASELCSVGASRSEAEAGQGMVEYALILALVALVVSAVLIALGPAIGDAFRSVQERMSESGAGAATPVATSEPGVTATPGPPGVVIDPSCSCFDCKGSSTGKPSERTPEDEHICFTNGEAYAVEMTGWTVADAVSHRYTFPRFHLQAGASVRLHSDRGADTQTNLYWGTEGNIWNDKGDTAYLRDGAGALVDEYSYGRTVEPVATIEPNPTVPPVGPTLP